MALEQITTSSTFRPAMIGDVVEVTMYDQSSGDLSTVAGVLAAYSTTPARTCFLIDGDPEIKTVPREGYTLSITHFEFVIDFSEEDSE